MQPSEVSNASPVVCQQPKTGDLRPCELFNIILRPNLGKSTNQIQTPFTNSTEPSLQAARSLGRIDLSDGCYQVVHDKDAKNAKIINCSRCADFLRVSMKFPSILQKCMKSTLSDIESVFISQPDVLVFTTKRDSKLKKVSSSRLRDKNFIIAEKKSSSKPVSNVISDFISK